jgi:hypothetical protein
MLSQHPVDRTLLHPLLEVCREQLAEAGIRPKLRTVLADAGYASEETFTRGEEQELRLLVPLAKDPAKHDTRTPAKQRDLAKLPATARAVHRALPTHPARRRRDRPRRPSQDQKPRSGLTAARRPRLAVAGGASMR